jgi:hypothetical protein
MPGRVGPSPAPWMPATWLFCGGVAAVAGGPGRPKEGAVLSSSAAPLARCCSSLQASSVCVPSTGGPRADLANDSITPSVVEATTTAHSRIPWSQQGQAQPSTSKALQSSRAHGTQREVAAGFLARRQAVDPACCDGRGSRTAEALAAAPWAAAPTGPRGPRGPPDRVDTVLARGGGTKAARRQAGLEDKLDPGQVLQTGSPLRSRPTRAA